jgi:hypothetical protein
MGSKWPLSWRMLQGSQLDRSQLTGSLFTQPLRAGANWKYPRQKGIRTLVYKALGLRSNVFAECYQAGKFEIRRHSGSLPRDKQEAW